MRTWIFAFFFLSSAAHAWGQIGFWTDHLPYYETIDVADDGQGLIFCATPYAVFAYDHPNKSVTRYNKTSVLSDVGVSAIGYSKQQKVLLVGYDNGNLDLIWGEAEVNLQDIAQSNILADKGIREVTFEGGLAYLSCGFGVVVLDPAKQEVSDTWFLGPDGIYVGVNDVVFDQTFVYAATEAGVYRAERGNAFLADFQNWDLVTEVPEPMANVVNLERNGQYMLAQIEDGNDDRIYVQTLETGEWQALPGLDPGILRDVHLSDTRLLVTTYGNLRFYDMDLNQEGIWGDVSDTPMRANAIIHTDNNRVWIANEEGGLLGFNFFGDQWKVLPDGPKRADVRRVEAWNNNVWISTGGVDASWVPNYTSAGTYGLVDRSWVWERNFGDSTFFDLMDASINPLDPTEVFFGSWYHGLIRMKDGEFTDLYNDLNSSLTSGDFGGSLRFGVGGLDFDRDGNLWFSNNQSATPLHVRTAGGEFQALNVAGLVDEFNRVTEVLAAASGYIWCMVPDQTGILVLDPGDTPGDPTDDSVILLDSEAGSGGLPSRDVFCMEEDLDGEMWVGLLEGLAVFYSQDCLFEGGENCDAQQILITQDGNVQILLETETVQAIEIDGANRKWVGTVNSGAFLLSPDGTQTVQHFTAENSPLLSNNVLDIAINHETGEVYFATEKGLIAYRGDATNYYPEMENVSVFPNPVQPGYAGDVIIDGLAQDADVKISDAAGNVVFQTVANGGRAVWDGQRASGGAVSTGIYFVYVSTTDGQSREVTKLAVVR